MSKTRWFCASTSILVRTIHWNLWNLSLCHEFAFHSCRIWTFLRNVHQVVDFVLIRVEHLPTLFFFLIQKCSEMHAGFFPTFFLTETATAYYHKYRHLSLVQSAYWSISSHAGKNMFTFTVRFPQFLEWNQWPFVCYYGVLGEELKNTVKKKKKTLKK